MVRLLVCLLVFLSGTAFAQIERDNKPRVPAPSSVVFDADSMYVGRLPYSGEPIAQRFDFRILQGGWARIEEVKPDCACAVAHFSKDTLSGGYASYIMVSFEPYKPGPFDKRFFIKWQGQEEPSELVLKGYLEPSTPQINMDFIHQAGSFKMKNRIISFGTIANDAVVKRKVEFFNNTHYGIKLAESVQMPKYIEFVIDSPSIVPPQGVGTATIFLHPEMKNDFGYTLDNIRLFTSDPVHKILDLNVSAVIRPSNGSQPPPAWNPSVLPAVQEEKPTVGAFPELWVESDILRLGSVQPNQSFVVSFALHNKGGGTLDIKHFESGVGCSVESIDRSNIPKGEFALLRLRIDGNGTKGSTIVRHIIVNTNDPKEPAKKLTVTATLQ